MTTETYQNAAYHLIAQAEDELALGDVRQASEKAWGAAAQAVKAVCEERGWQHSSHGLLIAAVRRLVDATGDELIAAEFMVAHQLHINFYEDLLIDSLVGQGLVAVRRLIERLESLDEDLG